MIFTAIFTVVALVLVAALGIWSKLSVKTILHLKHLVKVYTPEHKLKIVFVFYQIATRIPFVYEVTSLPVEVVSVLETLNTIVTFGMDNVATTPLECMRLEGYRPRLVFWMALPIVLTLVIFIVTLLVARIGNLLWGEIKRVRVYSRFSGRENSRVTSTDLTTREVNHGDTPIVYHLQRHEEKQRKSNTLEQVLHYVILVMFLLYPKVTNVAFEGFTCCASGCDSNA
jgi:hypothetical protein